MYFSMYTKLFREGLFKKKIKKLKLKKNSLFRILLSVVAPSVRDESVSWGREDGAVLKYTQLSVTKGLV